ncbi:MAG: hypothetical protein JSS11_10615 [Verrucomicrobia bacterium]|nr:hypothetical protein [Verrucomicrobiota bacterium]
MSKAIESHGPSWTEVILGAVLSVVLGVVLAAASLVLKPVVKAKELPKEPVAGTVYYLEGKTDSSLARQAVTKQNLFASGKSVAVTEEELNALVGPAPAAPGKDPAAPAAAPSGALSYGTPNFRVRQGELQIAVPVRVAVVGLDANLIVQARGTFTRSGDVFVFSPNTVYVGSCPVDRLPVAEGYFMKKIMEAKALPEGAVAAWHQLSDVTVDGSTLRLTMP